MDHKEWQQLRRSMAMHYLLSQAADMMIPNRDARPRIERWREMSDKNIDGPDTQKWRRAEYDMGEALIALEMLGYDITPKS